MTFWVDIMVSGEMMVSFSLEIAFVQNPSHKKAKIHPLKSTANPGAALVGDF
jgi:hypothetical protein